MFNLIIRQCLVAVCFFFFSVGLLAGAQLFVRASAERRLDRRHKASPPCLPQESGSFNNGLLLLAGVIAFSIFCNLLLIIPTLLEWISGVPGRWILPLHQLAVALITALTLGLTWTGVVCCLRPKTTLAERAGGDETGLRLLSRLPSVDRLTLTILSVVTAIYLTAVRVVGMNYDTGLYHLPSVLHFLHYGPEIGIANLHVRYSFYNLQLFGQVPWQNLSPGERILSPSLNLIFLAAFLLACSDEIFHRISIGHKDQQSIFGPILFLIVGLGLGIFSPDSLMSYDADLALSLSTLALLYVLVFSEQRLPLTQVWVLAPLLVLLKLSGVLSLLAIVLLQAFRLILSAMTHGPSRVWTSLRSSWQQTLSKAAILLSIAGSYLIMGITNVITSGYLLFPEYRSGPLAAHAVPRQAVRMMKDKWVTDYARFNDHPARIPDRVDGVIALADWLPSFLRTDRGQLLLFWLAAAVLLAALSTALWLLSRRRKDIGLLTAVSLTLVVLCLLTLLVLPPNPRFFPWVGALLAFAWGELFLLFPIVGLMAVTLLMAVIGFRLQRPFLVRLGNEPFTTWTLPAGQISAWKSRQSIDKEGAAPLVRSPINDDQCWAIQPPCSPFPSLLRERGKSADPLR